MSEAVARTTGADAESSTLLHRLGDPAPVRLAIAAYGGANRAAVTETDIVQRMRAVARLIIAAENLADEAKRFAADTRQALAASMQSAGCPPLEVDGHIVSWSNGARRVIITGEVPAAYMMTPPQPEPRPDTTAIAALLKKRVSIPNCTLSNGGDPVLTIRAQRNET